MCHYYTTAASRPSSSKYYTKGEKKLQQWPAGKWGVKRTHINLNIVIM